MAVRPVFCKHSSSTLLCRSISFALSLEMSSRRARKLRHVHGKSGSKPNPLEGTAALVQINRFGSSTSLRVSPLSYPSMLPALNSVEVQGGKRRQESDVGCFHPSSEPSALSRFLAMLVELGPVDGRRCDNVLPSAQREIKCDSFTQVNNLLEKNSPCSNSSPAPPSLWHDRRRRRLPRSLSVTARRKSTPSPARAKLCSGTLARGGVRRRWSRGKPAG